MRRLLGLTTLLALFVAGPAFAAPKKDKDKKEEEEDYSDEPMPDASTFKDAGEEEEEPAPPKPAEPDAPEEEEPDNLDFEDNEDGEDIKFEDDEEQQSVKPREAGEDTAKIYRDEQKRQAEASPDEELIAWENYLKKYPKSLFRERVDTRIEELSVLLFGERVPGSDRGARREDAANRELNFTSPLQFASADPRNRIGANVEIGIPNWAAPHVDAEFQLLRPFSVHVGMEQQVSGLGGVLGAKYAFIKSARTNTVVSAGLDLQFNGAPFYFGMAPRLNVGQKLNVMEGLFLELSLGVDGELRKYPAVRYFYGFSAELRPNNVVHAFVETSGTLKHVGLDEFEAFRFQVASFGIKFVPTKGGFPTILAEKGGVFVKHQQKPIVIILGANIPYSSRYWGFYSGSITLGAEWYL